VPIVDPSATGRSRVIAHAATCAGGRCRGGWGCRERFLSRRRSRSASSATARVSTRRRARILKGFTGIDDPYEAPEKPEMKLDTVELTPDLSAHRILVKLESMGFLK
jgi:Adenylylsulphate kinase